MLYRAIELCEFRYEAKIKISSSRTSFFSHNPDSFCSVISKSFFVLFSENMSQHLQLVYTSGGKKNGTEKDKMNEFLLTRQLKAAEDLEQRISESWGYSSLMERSLNTSFCLFCMLLFGKNFYFNSFFAGAIASVILHVLVTILFLLFFCMF